MALLRYQLFLGIGVAFFSIWYALLKSSEATSEASANVLIPYAPLWAILLLGVYAIGSIAYGLIKFKDSPEAAAEIEEQVLEAKAAMKKRGIIKDEQ
jgi:dolichyl-phosphate mannosyltransferase polypeptide 3